MAQNNLEYKVGWLSGYYPYAQYSVNGNNLVLGGDDNTVEQSILIRDVVKNSNSGYSQGGGGNLQTFRIREENVNRAFRDLEKKVDDYFKNGNALEKKKNGKEKMLMLSLRSLDGNKQFIKIYRKKNV